MLIIYTGLNIIYLFVKKIMDPIEHVCVGAHEFTIWNIISYIQNIANIGILWNGIYSNH